LQFFKKYAIFIIAQCTEIYNEQIVNRNISPSFGHTASERMVRQMKLSPEEYQTLQKHAAPPSKSWRNIPMAFLVGGLLCTVGQLLLTLYTGLGLEQDTAAAWTSITLVGCSALLTGFGVYEQLARYAGAGTLVPITGFANAIASSALEAKTEGFILGVGAKIFTIAGPVILYGCTASVVYGVIYYCFG